MRGHFHIVICFLLLSYTSIAQGLHLGTPDKAEISSTICADNAGNIYIGGSQNQFPFLTKMNDQGQVIWSKHIELHISQGDAYKISSLQIIADTLFGCGFRINAAGQDKGFFYFKFNATTGAIYWHRNTGVQRNYLSAIRYHDNKFFLIGGSYPSNKSCGKVVAISSQNAQEIWRTPEIHLTFPERTNFKTIFRGATEFRNGVMYVIGSTEGSGGVSNIIRPVVVGITENGAITMQKYLNIAGSNYPFDQIQGTSISFDGNDSLVMVCSNNSISSPVTSTIIIKTDLQLNSAFCKGYDLNNGSSGFAQTFNVTPTGYVLFGGMFTNQHNGLYIMKTNKQGVAQQGVHMFTSGIGYNTAFFNQLGTGNGDYKNGLHYFISPEDYFAATYMADVHPYVVDDNLQSPVSCDSIVDVPVSDSNLSYAKLDCGFINYTQTEPVTDICVITNLPFPDVCLGKSVSFSEQVNCNGTVINANPAGFINPIYNWSNGSTEPGFSVYTSDTLFVTISDINCCYVIDTIIPTISQNSLTVALPADTVICTGLNAVMFTIIPQVQANPNNATYFWNDNTTNPQITVNTSGIYWVDVTNSCGTIRDSITVTFNSIPVINGDTSIEACTVDFPVQYSPDIVINSNTMSWENGVPTMQRTIDSSGTYTLTATNTCGSTAFTVSVSELPLPEIDWINSIDTCLQAGDSLVLTPTYTNTDLINWSSGETSATIRVANSGNYIVTATNECGSESASALITVNYLPDLNLPFSIDTCFEIGEGFYYTAQGTPGNYSWSSGSQSATELITDIGIYAVTLSNGCGSVTDSMIVNRSANLSLSVSADSVLSCGGNFSTEDLIIETNYEYEILNEKYAVQSENILTTGWYYIRAFNKCGEVFDSVYINLQENQNFYLPNAFTPNQDEYNQYFSWKGENIYIREFRIFNRWGEEVYNGSTNDPGWDGTFKGQICPDGIYSIRIITENCVGIGEEHSGFVTLLR